MNKIKLIKMSHMNSFVHLTDLLCTQNLFAGINIARANNICCKVCPSNSCFNMWHFHQPDVFLSFFAI